MALINIKIFGIKISDTLSFKIIVGGTCIGLLLLLLGPKSFYDWTITSLITYIATILIILSVTDLFIRGELSTRGTIMLASGLILILVSCAKTYNSLMDTGISIIKAFVWATIFSIFIEAGKKHANKIEHHVRRLVEPRDYDHRREVAVDENGKAYRDEWNGTIGASTQPIVHIDEDKIRRRPYQKH